MQQTNNSAVKKKSILGILSLVIGVLVGIGFPIFEGLAALTHDDGAVSVWVFSTLLIAPIGIILGLIAVFTKRAWLGLVLNTVFLAIAIFILLQALLLGIVAVH